MNSRSALRILFVICFIFAMLCTIPPFGGFTGVFAFSAAIWTIVCLIFSRFENPLARLVPSVLSCVIIALLSLDKISQYPVAAVLTLALGILFSVFMTLGHFEAEYWRFKRTFIGLFSVSALTSAINIVIFIAVNPRTKALINLEGIVGFTFAAALLGVFCLSELRKGDADAKWKAMNSTKIVALLGLMATALILLYLLLAFGFSQITPIVGRIAQRRDPNYATYESRRLPYSQQTNTPGGQGEVKDQLEDREIMVPKTDEEKEPINVWIVLAIAVPVTGVVTFLVVRHIKKKKKNAEAEDKNGSKTDRKTTDNVEKIRAIYRQYISFVQKRGGELTKGSTSEDILSSSSEIANSVSPKEQELRDIYIRARYAKPEEITAEDVARAQTLLEEISVENPDEQK